MEPIIEILKLDLSLNGKAHLIHILDHDCSGKFIQYPNKENIQEEPSNETHMKYL